MTQKFKVYNTESPDVDAILPVEVYSGTDVPSNSLGNNGAYYYRTNNGTESIYKKASDAWNLSSGSVGATGATGSTGAVGQTGAVGNTGATQSDHQLLSNLSATGAHPATAISTSVTNFTSNILTASETNTQLALNKIESVGANRNTLVNDIKIQQWITRTSSDSISWFSVYYDVASKLFVACGGGPYSCIMISSDGVQWVRSATSGGAWRSVTASLNNYSPPVTIFVACTSGGTIYYSYDAITWTSIYSDGSSQWMAMANGYEPDGYGSGNLCVLVSSGGTYNLAYSTNASINVTPVSSVPNRQWTSICYGYSVSLGGSYWVAVANSGTGDRVMRCTGDVRINTNWVLQTSAADYDWNSVCFSYDLTLFCAVSLQGAMTSPDGATWTLVTATVAGKSICWSSQMRLFVVVGGSSIYTSPDGINWTPKNYPTQNVGNWTSVCYSPNLNMFCAVSSETSVRSIMTTLSSQDLAPSGYYDEIINWTNSSATYSLTTSRFFYSWTKIDVWVNGLQLWESTGASASNSMAWYRWNPLPYYNYEMNTIYVITSVRQNAVVKIRYYY